MKSASVFHLKIAAVLLLCCVAGAVPSARAQTDDKEMFLVAQKAYEDGFYDVAIRYIDQLLTQHPDTNKRIEARLLLGQCYFFKSQYLKAYEVFNDLLQYTDYRDHTLYWLGETYLKGTDYQQAKKHYRQLISLYPDSVFAPQALYSVGWVEFEQNQFREAAGSFAELKKKFPEHQLAEDATFKLGEIEYNLRHFEKTIDAFNLYLEQYPRSTKKAEAFFYIAESYYYLEDPLTAVTYYAKTAEIAYDNKLILMARVSLGWCYLKLEKFSLAADNFSTALTFAEEKGILSDDIYLGQATLYTRMEKYSEALDAYQNLIDTFPNSRRIKESYLGKANIFYKLEQFDRAIVHYEKVTLDFEAGQELTDTYEKAFFGLAWSHLKNNDITQAVRQFEIIKNRAQKKTVKISAMTQIGDAYQDAGEWEKAVSVYDEILREYPESQYADYVQYRQGIALLKMEKIEAATLSFQTLRSNFADSKYLADVNYYLAVAYFKKSNWTLAKHQILKFLEQQHGRNELTAEALYILGLSQFNLKEYDSAVLNFKKITRNYPLDKDMLLTAELGIAKALYEKGDTAEGVSNFQQIAIRYPNSREAQESLIWLGDHYLRAGEYQRSIDYYSQFVKSFPGSDSLGMAYFEIGQAHAALAQFDKAVEAFNKINKENGRELFVKARLAIADIFSQEMDPESALTTYRNVIETSPEFKRDAFVKIAEVYRSTKDYDKAIQSLGEALGVAKKDSLYNNSEIQFRIADTYQLLNQSQKAIDEYMKVPYLYPDDKSWVVKSYLRLGRIFEDDEQWPEAISAYQKVIDLKTDEMKFAKERVDWISQFVE
ncbi:MAG: tetratricopeptide repeat protein [Candidatus Omnitrophica bacterium]|nr:tetratricopeptide repeat protein [Candidatus Omnitrophota bacterium]MCB9721813.1 tetratricopeptide repeat protein [Candidatus Omnitrophota bacterium]